jgi:hypothetical protein
MNTRTAVLNVFQMGETDGLAVAGVVGIAEDLRIYRRPFDQEAK